MSIGIRFEGRLRRRAHRELHQSGLLCREKVDWMSVSSQIGVMNSNPHPSTVWADTLNGTAVGYARPPKVTNRAYAKSVA